jgi:U4/U6 small nuclear ribonucleoprotein PRP3
MDGIADSSFQSMPQTGRKNKPVEQTQQGAGLKMAAHPLLLDTTPALPQSKKDRYKPMQPKFASIKVSVGDLTFMPCFNFDIGQYA